MKKKIVLAVSILVVIVIGIYLYIPMAVTAKMAENATYDVPNYVTMRNEAYPAKLINGKGMSNSHPVSLEENNIVFGDFNNDGVTDARVTLDVDISYKDEPPGSDIVKLEYVVTGRHHVVKTYSS